jgi:hypothetical protein
MPEARTIMVGSNNGGKTTGKRVEAAMNTQPSELSKLHQIKELPVVKWKRCFILTFVLLDTGYQYLK